MPGNILLNDGTELEGSVMQDESTLWIDAEGTFRSVCKSLMDPVKTGKITVREYGVINEYKGFTHLFYLRETDGEKISAGLVKGVG